MSTKQFAPYEIYDQNPLVRIVFFSYAFTAADKEQKSYSNKSAGTCTGSKTYKRAKIAELASIALLETPVVWVPT